MNGNLRTNEANGKRRPSGNGHISRSSSGRNFGFLRYLKAYFLSKCTNFIYISLLKMDQCHIFCQ